MLPVKTQDPWISLLVNSCLCYCISLREDCRMFVYHGYECLTDPRLYKADLILLSLALESYSLYRCLLALWVASYLKKSYCALRADMYLHYFVA